MPVPWNQQDTNMFTRPWPNSVVSTDLSCIKDLHPATQRAIQQCVNHHGKQITGLRLYTDGSAVGAAAAWAVIIIADLPDDQMAWLGYFAGEVITDPVGKGYVGADKCTNGTAELSAVLWACMWAHQCEAIRGVPITVLYDSTYAGGIAAHAMFPNVNALMAETTQQFMYMAAATLQTTWRHVRAHNGDPWNEMADRVANAARGGKVGFKPFTIPVSSWIHEGSLKPEAAWAFLANPTTVDKNNYPPTCDGKLFITPPTVMEEPAQIAQKAFPRTG